MSYTWDDFVKEVREKYPKAKPEKVIKFVRKSYRKPGEETNYDVRRNSWSLLVIEAIQLKIGTTDPKRKISTRTTIRNWIKTDDFKRIHRMLMGPVDHLDSEVLVKRVNDIWVNPKNKKYKDHFNGLKIIEEVDPVRSIRQLFHDDDAEIPF